MADSGFVLISRPLQCTRQDRAKRDVCINTCK